MPQFPGSLGQNDDDGNKQAYPATSRNMDNQMTLYCGIRAMFGENMSIENSDK